MERTGLEVGIVNSFGNDDETSGSINGEVFVDQLSDHQYRKKDNVYNTMSETETGNRRTQTGNSLIRLQKKEFCSSRKP
jgi:hypothetical protein